MPPRPVHGSPEDWLRRAQASLALARVHGEGLLREDLCYQAQQAAEKALKALYIARGQAFLFTHDLDRLAMGLDPDRTSRRVNRNRVARVSPRRRRS